jgi:hypothetical protein
VERLARKQQEEKKLSVIHVSGTIKIDIGVNGFYLTIRVPFRCLLLLISVKNIDQTQ